MVKILNVNWNLCHFTILVCVLFVILIIAFITSAIISIIFYSFARGTFILLIPYVLMSLPYLHVKSLT